MQDDLNLIESLIEIRLLLKLSSTSEREYCSISTTLDVAEDFHKYFVRAEILPFPPSSCSTPSSTGYEGFKS